IFFSVLGLSTLTVSVSLPLGFLTNLVSPPVIPPPVIDTPYDPNVVLSKTNVDFNAYYVFGWKELTLSDVLEQISLQRDSVDPSRQINLQSLANLGIVPSNDNWKSWVWVRAIPIEGRSNSFRMAILETIAAEAPFSYDVSVKNGAIKPSTLYDIGYKLAGNANFYAYTPATLTTLSDYYLNYQKTSSNPLTTISIRNLEVIGIVPIFDQYKSWESITLFPVDGKTIKVNINTGASTNPIVTYNITGITTSTFYNASSATIASNANFVAYTPNSFKNTTLVNLNLTFTKDSQNPATALNFENLDKIGIVPLNNNYKEWDSISIYPISGNKVKSSVKISASATPIEYEIVGVKPSAFYDINTAPIYNNSTEFIMYVPIAWTKMFPVEAALTLTSSSTNPATKISLETLEKIGIVPKNLEYKNWSSITITALASATCKIVIKKNNDANIVSEFNASCLKTSGTYNAAEVLYTGNTTPFKFIWYKPKTWATTLPNDISLSFTSSNITLDSLEKIGIVPLNKEYTSWQSILKSDILYGLQGKFGVTMTSSTQPNSPLTFDVAGLKTSEIYNSSIVILHRHDFIQFKPFSFAPISGETLTWLGAINWINREINLENLAKIGVVPIHESWQRWHKVRFDYKTQKYIYIIIEFDNLGNTNSYISLQYQYSY
ncbi:MAG: hypothetical protein RSA87_04265, partial [Malacoplasma sp.]